MLNSRLDRELEKGMPAPLYFFYGKENLLLEQVMADATARVIAAPQMDFNYDIFYPPGPSQEIMDTASTLPFMARRRIVIIRDFHQFLAADIDAMIPYFQNPNDATCMLIFSSEEPKLKNINWHVFQIKIKENEIPLWLEQVAAKKGVNISENAIDYLIDTVGADLGLLNMEIEKLSLAGLKKIGIKEIIPYIGTTREYVPFNLIDALIAGRKTEVFKILRKITDRSSSDAPAVIGALNWYYKQFFDLWGNKGEKPPKMKEYTFRTFSRYVKNFSLGKFNLIFQYLHEADVEIKSLSRPELTLEVLLIRLLQAGAKN